MKAHTVGTVDYYGHHSAQSAPESFEGLFAEAGSAPADWIRTIQGLLVHADETERYGITLNKNAFREELLRDVPRILGKIREIDPSPFGMKRPEESRMATICRTYALLFASIARSRGEAVRLRAGYSNYLGGPMKWADHWIAELWVPAESRWVRVDPSLDETIGKSYGTGFGPVDVPAKAFTYAASAWKLCRERPKVREQYGFAAHWSGWDSLKATLLKDFEATNLVETLPWDLFGSLAAARGDRLSDAQFAALDRIADALESNDYEAIEELWLRSPHGRETRAMVALLSGGARKEERDSRKTAVSGITRLMRLSGMTAGTGVPAASSRPKKNADSPGERLSVRGARAHNLKGVDADFGKAELTVITGPSGSGKSSLAFDVLYAACRRDYWDCFGADFTVQKPARVEADSVAGTRPAVAVDQRAPGANSRSTVATVTGAADDIRLLYALASEYRCPICGRPMEGDPVGEVAKNITLLIKSGYRVSIGPTSGEEKTLIAGATPDIVERTVREALDGGDGIAEIGVKGESGTETIRIGRPGLCANCGLSFRPRAHALFDPDRYDGACTECGGTGSTLSVDPEKIVTDPSASLLDGASPWWGTLRGGGDSANWMRGEVFALAERHGIDLELPWKRLPAAFRKEALYGTDGKAVKWEYRSASRGRAGTIERPILGAVGNILRLFRTSTSETSRQFLKSFMSETPCPTCGGERLCPEARSAVLAGLRYPEAISASVSALRAWVAPLVGAWGEAEALSGRLEILEDLGLGYLSLDRKSTDISGGEAQRLKLASRLVGGKSGILFFVDEPSRGLHPSERENLFASIARLARQSEGVIAVEHAPEILAYADRAIMIGPGAGTSGGTVVFDGKPAEMPRIGKPAGLSIGTEGARGNGDAIEITGARLHTLKNVSARFPLDGFTVVTGPSGSGKSSLLLGTLVPALESLVEGKRTAAGPYDAIEGWKTVGRIVSDDQDAAARSCRSTPATYSGILDALRDAYAEEREAKRAKLGRDAFSFNTPAGRCPRCKGLGRVANDGLEALNEWTVCEECGGTRFARSSLSVSVNGRTIAESLALSVDEAADAFAEMPGVAIRARALSRAGLGYLRLDQGMDTLSGGESRRVKLASALAEASSGKRPRKTLFVLDEPGAGLHESDQARLVEFIRDLIDEGHAVAAISHDISIMAAADWIVELGPGGGPEGGSLVAQGTPGDLAAARVGLTGKCLAGYAE